MKCSLANLTRQRLVVAGKTIVLDCPPLGQRLASWLLVGCLLISGCQTTPTGEALVADVVPEPVVQSSLSTSEWLSPSPLEGAEPRPPRLLGWPLRNDAGSDLLLASELAIVRAFRERRDPMVARLVVPRLKAMDDALRQPLEAAGFEVVARDPAAGLELDQAIAAVEADALLTARVVQWDRGEPFASDGVALRLGIEVTLLARGEVTPLFTWSLSGVELTSAGTPGAPRSERGRSLDDRITALFERAGLRLAEELRRAR